MKIGILILSFCFLASAKENLKKWQTQASFVQNGKGFQIISPQEQNDSSFNESDLGFSFEKKSNEMGLCRLRWKVVCDYGLAFQKALKNTEVVVEIDKKLLNGKTDSDGMMDGSFECPAKIQDMEASLHVKNHQLKFRLKDSPGLIKIPEKVCR